MYEHVRTAVVLILCEHLFIYMGCTGAVQVYWAVRRDEPDHERFDEGRDCAASGARATESCRVGGESLKKMIKTKLRNDRNFAICNVVVLVL